MRWSINYNIYEHQLNKLSGKFDHARFRRNHYIFGQQLVEYF